MDYSATIYEAFSKVAKKATDDDTLFIAIGLPYIATRPKPYEI